MCVCAGADGVCADGTKELISLSDGLRVLAGSWAGLLRDPPNVAELRPWHFRSRKTVTKAVVSRSTQAVLVM